LLTQKLVIDQTKANSCSIINLNVCRWGIDRFVIVASQQLRRLTLCGRDKSDVVELNDMQYCVLERIGR